MLFTWLITLFSGLERLLVEQQPDNFGPDQRLEEQIFQDQTRHWANEVVEAGGPPHEQFVLRPETVPLQRSEKRKVGQRRSKALSMALLTFALLF